MFRLIPLFHHILPFPFDSSFSLVCMSLRKVSLCAWPLPSIFPLDFEAWLNILSSLFICQPIFLNVCFLIKLSACPSWFLTLDHELLLGTPLSQLDRLWRSEYFSRSVTPLNPTEGLKLFQEDSKFREKSLLPVQIWSKKWRLHPTLHKILY